MLKNLIADLHKLKNPSKAALLQRFFKTGKGQYGEGDIFLGLTSEEIKNIAKNYYKKMSQADVKLLLSSKIHEERMCALRILVYKYEKEKNVAFLKQQIYNFYLRHVKWINNWDLVDVTAPHIIGDYLLDKDRVVLYRLAKSKNLWSRRIAVISTFAFIRVSDFQDSLKLAIILLSDEDDLIHKAVGWMLREVGKRDKKVLIDFLSKHSQQMPRTMLRYAIEKMPEPERKKYLSQSKVQISNQ